MRHRDGHRVWILAAGRVIERDAKGQATRMAGVHVDISARKAYETAFRRSDDQPCAPASAKSEFLANRAIRPMNGVMARRTCPVHRTERRTARLLTDTIRTWRDPAGAHR